MSNAPPKQKTTARRSRMRFEVLNRFIDEGISKYGLTPHEAMTWVILYRDTQPNGQARTAVVDIASRAGISRRTVIRSLARLKNLKLLHEVRHGGLNRGPSSYVVTPVPMAPD